MKLSCRSLALVGLCLVVSPACAAPFADIIAIVDESGSMGGEHAFMGPAMSALDTSLNGNGLSPNQFGLVGFGGASSHLLGHTHLVGGTPFGTAAQFSTATGSLVLSGGTEDGYSGIMHALSYPFRAGSARNLILVTDEDRDNAGNAFTYGSTLSALDDAGAVLNAIVSAQFRDGNGNVALGIDSDGNAFIADGMGGFTISPGGVVLNGAGTTVADYVNLALATGGAAWDLNQLRLGGLTADSFAAAFTHIKTEEIITASPVPEPASMLAWGLIAGVGAMGYRLRKRKNVAAA